MYYQNRTQDFCYDFLYIFCLFVCLFVVFFFDSDESFILFWAFTRLAAINFRRNSMHVSEPDVGAPSFSVFFLSFYHDFVIQRISYIRLPEKLYHVRLNVVTGYQQ